MFRFAQHDSPLQNNFQSVTCDHDSSLFDLCPFSTARPQNRVRIVYVSKDLPACWRLAQEIETAVADGQMIHLARSAGSRSHCCQFAIGPECSVEQSNGGCVNGIPQLLG